MPAEESFLDPLRPCGVHIVGIGGAGMSAIAIVLAEMGHRVSGSDLRESAVVERLRARGLQISIGHHAEWIADAEVVTYSPAVREGNAELVEARRLGLRVVTRAEVLSTIASSRRCVAVAGTHGKTTTASMLALALVEAGMQPSFLIGADVNEIGTNAVWGNGEWMVLEADESFGTFRTLRPEVCLVTNVEADHLDHYGTFDSLKEAFAEVLAATSGVKVVGADNPTAAELGRSTGARSVGTREDADYRMVDLALSRSTVAFDLMQAGRPCGRVTVPVPGLHNARNAAMAVVGALEIGVRFCDIATALARFAGVPRRFEFRGAAHGVTFVDDYAHLPNEVRATLAAARSGSWDRVVAVFQPHRYSRTAALANDFAGAFDDADMVFVTDIYGADESPVPGVSGKLIVDALLRANPDLRVSYEPSREGLRERLREALEPGDLCCTMGAGDLTSMPDELLEDPSW